MSEINLINPELPKNTRHFFDPEKTREWVKQNAKEAFQNKLNKIESLDFKLNVKDIEYADEHKHFSLNDQKKALMEKQDLAYPLKGTFELVDKKTGKVVDSKKTIIAQIPYVTPRNTTVINGSEYITIHQQRLKPGVYSRIKETGEAEAHVNVKPGTGLGGKIVFHPEKAQFVFEVGTTQIKLYGLLKGLGVSDTHMEDAWGKEIFMKNKLAFKGDELDKFHNKIFSFNK
jgi:DNA-directed RNA polymerase beta subunit